MCSHLEINKIAQGGGKKKSLEQLFLCWMNPEFLRYPPMFKENVNDLSFSPDNCNYLIVRQLLPVSGNVTCALASTQAYKDQYRSEKKKTTLASFCALHNREWELFSSPSANVVVNQGSQWQWQWQPSLQRQAGESAPPSRSPIRSPTPTQNVPFSYFFHLHLSFPLDRILFFC